jgi:hypothetical protein
MAWVFDPKREEIHAMNIWSVLRRLVVLTLLVSTLLVRARPAASRSLPIITSPVLSAHPFSGWVSLGKPSGYSLGLPVVGYNQDGRIELFAMGSNNHVWHIFQTDPNGAWSTGWGEFVGGDSYCAIVGENLDGRMELFNLQYDLAIWHTWQGVPNGPFVGSWETFGWPATGVSATCPRVNRNQDGRLEVFTIGNDGNVYSMPQASPNDGWGSWVNFGKPPGRSISSLAMGHDQDGRMFFFVLGDDQAIYFRWQSAINDGWDPDWWGMGKPTGVNLFAPAVGDNPDGRQEIFTIGDDGNLWHINQVAPNAGWSAWSSLGKPPSGLKAYRQPVVGYNQDGTMEVIAPSYDFNFWHIGQTAPGDGWSGWASLGQPSVGLLDEDPAAGQQQNGRLMVFASGKDGAIWSNITGSTIYLPLVIK